MKNFLLFIFLIFTALRLQAEERKSLEQELSFKSDGPELHGTLLLPEGTGPFPLVVLVHGSGPHDRNETVFANTTFKDIAEGLAEKGVASYRYDKRRLSPEMKKITVYDETINDAVAAADLFKSDSRISKIYILGHSLGGMLIPRIASKSETAAGYIILAGAARPLEDLILEQTEYILGNDKSVSQDCKQLQMTIIKNMAQNIKELTPDSKKMTGELMGAPASYWLDLKGYEPAKEARRIAKPVLVLQGIRDYQVTMADFDIWRKELAGKANAEFKSYVGLNHLFIYGIGKSLPAEYMKKGRVADEVIADIASFVKSH